MCVVVLILSVFVPANCRSGSRPDRGNHVTRMTVNIIDKAISMYHAEHKVYPDKKSMPSQLIGLMYETDGTEVDDGEPGPGYRLRARGTIYGPWNGVDKLKRTGDFDGNNRVFFLDPFNRPIWYCPFTGSADSANSANAGYADAEFTNEDSEDGINISDIAEYAKDASGKFYRRDYILMSPGADGKWGLFSNTDKDLSPTDDITNFIE
jgi:hypothetical protein